MRTVLTIARKEIQETFLSVRFGLFFVLAVLLIPASLYTNYRSYVAQLADQQQLQRRSTEELRGLGARLFTDPNLWVDVYLPPSPAGVFATGFEETHPRHLRVGEYGVELGAPLQVRSSLGLFGELDYLFVVQLLFSLFGILVSFDAVTRERELGTLRSILTNPIRRSSLALGKFVGGYTMLALPLVISFVAGILVLSASGLDVFGGAFPVRALSILGSSLLYLAAFFFLGLLVSSLSRSSFDALVVSLALWLLLVLVLPRGAVLAARLIRPVESRQALLQEKVALEEEIERAKGRALQGLFDREPESWHEARRAVAAPFEEHIARETARLEQAYRRRVAAQRGLGLTLARLSPTGALTSFATEVAGTGASAERRFLADAERYRDTLRTDLFSKVYYDSVPSGATRMGADPTLDPSALPTFTMTPPDPAESFRGTDLAILAAWCTALALGSFAALERCDVR